MSRRVQGHVGQASRSHRFNNEEAHMRNGLLSGILIPLAVLCLLPALALQLPAARGRARDAEVAALIDHSRRLTEEARYGEAAAVCQQILCLDPRNDYAIGVLPLLYDKVVMSEQRRWRAVHGGSDAPEPAHLEWPPIDDLSPGPATRPAAGRPGDANGAGRAVRPADRRQTPTEQFPCLRANLFLRNRTRPRRQ